MIALPPLGELDLELWHALLDIADREPADWTLIGGQMVLLHALEHGRTPHRVSQDIDVVVDARVRPPALARVVSSLLDLGFAEAAISADEIAHRFQRGRVAIDVLAPEGLGPRTDLRTVGAATTVAIGEEPTLWPARGPWRCPSATGAEWCSARTSRARSSSTPSRRPVTLPEGPSAICAISPSSSRSWPTRSP